MAPRVLRGRATRGVSWDSAGVLEGAGHLRVHGVAGCPGISCVAAAGAIGETHPSVARRDLDSSLGVDLGPWDESCSPWR